MEKRKVYLLSDDNESLFINTEDIVTYAVATDDTYIIENVTLDEETLTKKLREYIETKEATDGDFEYDWDFGEEELQSSLVELGFEDAEVSYIEKYPEIREQLVCILSDRLFYNLERFETEKVYEYHDGRNYQSLPLYDYFTETELEITKDYVSLDEWDGYFILAAN